VAERLAALGADVRAADPHVRDVTIDAAVTRVEATPEEAAAADAVVLVTDHDRFDLDAIVAAAPYVLDTCNRVAGPHVERL
jgi:UDP-N-acetyl-D-glucosamine dehydrogenase